MSGQHSGRRAGARWCAPGAAQRFAVNLRDKEKRSDRGVLSLIFCCWWCRGRGLRRPQVARQRLNVKLR